MLFAAVPTALASTTWYVNGVSGSDSNTCLSASTACKTIKHAISLTASGDTVMVAAATYRENPIIGKSLTVIGSGVASTIIDGNRVNTVVRISSARAIVSLSHLTIANGATTIGTLNVGGGIKNTGVLTIYAVYITNNRSCHGGGIFNEGALTINQSTISENFVSGGGYCNLGAGIANFYEGSLTVNNSTISGNTASGGNGPRGGGIFNTEEGTVTVNNSTISGNTASGGNGPRGGGICNTPDGGTVIVNNSTITGNVLTKLGTSGPGTEGGAIANLAGSGKLKINSSTISANQAQFGGNLYGAATLQNSIVANNSGGNCSGTMTSKGYNLSSDGSCSLNGPGDMNNINPMLGTLGNYGGPTQTIPLRSGSPAIDAGNPSGCTDGQGHLLQTDQRGKPRHDPEDIRGCDRGAYERQSD
jgi:hypothetical protein